MRSNPGMAKETRGASLRPCLPLWLEAWLGLINSHLFSRLTKSQSAVISHKITHLCYRCVVSCYHACRTPAIFGRCSSAFKTTELLNNLCPVRYNISRCNLRRLCFGYLISYLHAKCNPSMAPRFNSNYCPVHRGYVFMVDCV